MFLMAVVVAGGLAFMVVLVSTKDQYDTVSSPTYNFTEVFSSSLCFFPWLFFVFILIIFFLICFFVGEISSSNKRRDKDCDHNFQTYRKSRVCFC